MHRTPAGVSRSGTELGAAALGPMAGHADRASTAAGSPSSSTRARPISWLLETQGLDQATTVELARRGGRGRRLARCASPTSSSSGSSPATSSPSRTCCVRRTSQGWPMGELLGAGRRRDGGPVAGPAARLHGVARPPAAAARDRRARTRPSTPTRWSCSAAPRRRSSPSRTSTSSRATTRSSCGRPTRACTRSRGHAGADVTLHELQAADGWAIDVDAAAPPGHAADAADRRQRPAQPDRLPARTPRPIGPSPEHRRGRRRHPPVRRGVPVPRARPGRPAAGRRRRRPRTGSRIGVMSKSFALAGLRIGWLATHDRAPARRDGAVQGLHDDLRLGARRRSSR